MMRTRIFLTVIVAAVACSPVLAAEAGKQPVNPAEAQKKIPAEQNPRYYIDLANVNLRYDENEKAIDLLSKAIELQEGENIDLEIIHGLTRAYFALDEIDKAEATLAMPLETMNDDMKPGYLVSVARLYKGKGMYEKAEAALLQAKELVQDERLQMRILKELLDLYKGTPLGQQAITKFEQRLEKNPKDVQAVKALMDLYLYDSKLDKATEMAARYAELNPKDTEALKDLTFFYASLGELDKTIDTCVRLAEIDPENKADYYTRIIYICQEMGDLAKAEKWADKATKEGVTSASTYSALGDAYLKAENTAKALECYQRAIDLSPENNARFKFSYAKVLAETGKKEEAKKMLLSLIEKDNSPVKGKAQQLLLSIYTEGEKQSGQK